MIFCAILCSMARKWTKNEEKENHAELRRLYVTQNKSIREISLILNIAQQTVFQRLVRLGIQTNPSLKNNYLKKRSDVRLPNKYSGNLAEFFGVMLGNGHVSHFQVTVTLGNKEMDYAKYVQALVSRIFNAPAKISIRSSGYTVVYLGSTLATSWLFKGGLVSNKVKSQIGVPQWIFYQKVFMRRFLRGFFDTDGSVYKIRHGIQISFTNYSLPLLEGLQNLLSILGYIPSEVSSHKIYLTKRKDIERFFKEINPKNQKHQKRFNSIYASVG